MKVGAAFSDHIKIGELHKRHYDFDSERPVRHYILIILLIIFPGIILLRLITIQIVYGRYYRTISDTNRTKTNILYPPRGIIFDRDGSPLVINIPTFEKTDEEETAIPREKAIELMTRSEKLQIDSARYYPMREVTAHIIGYVGNISKEELSQPAYGAYTSTDVIGKSGIERYYDKLLRGFTGKELVEVDALGKKLRTLGQTDPIPGQDISLTLDVRLQEAAYDAFPHGKKGVIIVTTPTGEILTMVSRPSFDPNLFTQDGTYIATESAYKQVEDVLRDEEFQPLMNRAISGMYPPGSTFKLITAAAGLEQKIIDRNYKVEDTGILQVGEFSFGNWYFLEYGKKEGIVDIVKAISRSNDIFFYKLAEKISVDKLSRTGSLFGLGKKLGVDLPGEMKGILPTTEWKKKVIKENWYLGDTYHYGIGQGYLLTTPLQVVSWTATIANGGTFQRPHLLKNSKLDPSAGGRKILSENTISLIKEGMIDSCQPGGVAWPLFEFKIQNSALRIDGRDFLTIAQATNSAQLRDYRQITVACKTGTAEHGGQGSSPHAWITLFAPAYNPQIVVTVLVESGGQGSDVAAPIAKKILEEWFTR